MNLKILPALLINRKRLKLKKDESKECIAALKAKTEEFHYSHCEVKFDSVAKLKHHERKVHMKTSSIQTSDKTLDDKFVQVYSSKLLKVKAMQANQEVTLKLKAAMLLLWHQYC